MATYLKIESNRLLCTCPFTFPLLEVKLRGKYKFVEFEVLTAVVMKSTVFWDITLCSRLKVNRRFGETYRHHRQGRQISQVRNQRKAVLATSFHAGFLLGFFFDPEDEGDKFLRNVRSHSTDYTALYP
jgi:hypothetical protein